jgi:hypothetical protein
MSNTLFNYLFLNIRLINNAKLQIFQNKSKNFKFFTTYIYKICIFANRYFVIFG